MSKRVLMLLLIIAGATFFSLAQEEMRLMRFPAIHGDQVVFSYAGDLYTVNVEGGIARRLTTHPGYEMFSRFSPDGKQIAFTAQYDGNTEIYVMPSTGGKPKRLTYTATLMRDDISDRMGPNNIAITWTPDGKNIIYRSRAISFNDFIGHLFSVPVDGGMSERLPLSTGGFCSYSPDGKKLAFNRVFREFRTWKYYKGGMADDIWIYDFQSKEIINITENESQDIIPMWYGDKIFYISDRDRVMNLFVYDLNTKTDTKITHYNDYDIKFPSLGDGKIIYEQAGCLNIYDIETGEITVLNIQIADDIVASRIARKDASENIQSLGLSPDGKRLVVTARGDIFSVPVENGITRNLTATPKHHDRGGVWSPNGKYIAYISDKTGENEIYIQVQDGSAEPVQITENTETYIYRLAWSPDNKKILFNDKTFRISYVDIESKEVTIVATNKVWEFTNFNWSPDSKWITYTLPVRTGMNQIMLYDVVSGKTHEITDHWYSSSGAVFSDDGKFLAFVSQRDFSPIYSQTEWNHAYRNMARVYIIPLSKDTDDPFKEKSDEVEIKRNDNDDGYGSGSLRIFGRSKDKDNENADEKIKVDIEGIQGRVIALPVRPSNYSNINIIGSKVYYSENYFGERGRSIRMYDLEKKEETTIAENMSFSISNDGKKMLLSARNKYYVISLPTSMVKPDKAVDMSNMWVNTDLLEEWKQIYTESWRQMRDFFYDENMHAVDWDSKHDKYAHLLPYVNNRNDLNYLIGELIGELNVGHAYVGGGDRYTIDKVYTGLLGANISRDESGFYRIDKILAGQNWDNSLVSPLTRVGLNINEGDFIIAIDGNDVRKSNDIYSLLLGKADVPVEITINTDPAEEGSRKVIVKPIKDESGLYYFNWVQENIRKVNEETDGRVGYIHIPDMVVTGLNEFVKYYYPQLSKEALIIDGRGNGGGNVSPMIIERLRREIIRVSVPRNVKEVSTVPRGMMTGPMVLLINQYSASDGDLFPYAFKRLELGKVIGTRSWGGVIGIRGSLPFLDGGTLSKPEFGTYCPDTGEWIIEGYGVDPDIVIDNDPAREHEGIDDQLNKAIEVILLELEDAYQIPTIPEGPDKSN